MRRSPINLGFKKVEIEKKFSLQYIHYRSDPLHICWSKGDY